MRIKMTRERAGEAKRRPSEEKPNGLRKLKACSSDLERMQSIGAARMADINGSIRIC